MRNALVLALWMTMGCGAAAKVPEDGSIAEDLTSTADPLDLAPGDALEPNADMADGSIVATSIVPGPAAAVGYNTKTFDSTTVGTKAGELLPFTFFGLQNKPAAYTQNKDGSLTLTGDSADSYNADVSTAQADSTQATKWHGTAFGGGAYFEAEFSFTGTPKGYTVKGWPAWWADDIESISGGYTSTVQWPGQAAGYNDTIEVDFIEALVASSSEYGSGMHNWYGPSADHMDVPESDNPVSIGTAKFSSLNKYGCLWVPATANTQGSVKFFFNGTQQGKTIVWDKYDASLPPKPVAGSSAMSVLDTRDLAPILGVSNTDLPMTITSVTVWQASKANNLTQ